MLTKFSTAAERHTEAACYMDLAIRNLLLAGEAEGNLEWQGCISSVVSECKHLAERLRAYARHAEGA